MSSELAECLISIRQQLQQAERLAMAEQCDATYELSHGRFSSLVASSGLTEVVRLLLVQINHLLNDHHGNVPPSSQFPPSPDA